jgi:hypothetical protein
LAKLGITGKALRWFESYMSSGRQAVVWNDVSSTFIGILYGVRQGSILGPLLYNIHVADMPACLDVGEECNTGYADDTVAWQVGDNLESVRSSLQKVANRFAEYTKGNGLSQNAAKTQLMYNSKRGNEYMVAVDGAVIDPASSLELLGVRYDQQLTPKPYIKALVTAVRTRALLVVRLGHHLPQGQLLRQITTGLMGGKIGHALAAVAAPRLLGKKASGDMAALQVTLNDMARTITGGNRKDRTKVVTLLESAKLSSGNEMVVSAIGMEAWKAYWSRDGGDGQEPGWSNALRQGHRGRGLQRALIEVGYSWPDPSPPPWPQHVCDPRGKHLEFVPHPEGGEDQGGSLCHLKASTMAPARSL